MQENTASAKLVSNVTITGLEVAPSFATNNMIVTVDDDNYLLNGDGLANMVRALIMAKTMGMTVSFTTTGYVNNGYGYISSVTL